jgi:hypothetical protein
MDIRNLHKDFNKLENDVLLYVYKKYIGVSIMYDEFKKSIIKPYMNITQDMLIEMDRNMNNEDRCYFIIMVGNKIRRCLRMQNASSFYCSHHDGQPNILEDEYNKLYFV